MSARHLLSIDDLSAEDIGGILDTADAYSETLARTVKKLPVLRGQTVINLFFEDSTRTRSSFELAAKRLSADVLTIYGDRCSANKGESLRDTILTLGAYEPAAIVMRSKQNGAAHEASLASGQSAIINAGDGTGEHPTQALLDLHALRAATGSLAGKRIWIVGDIVHSRVAGSGVRAWQKMGAEVTFAGPPGVVDEQRAAEWGVEVVHNLRALHEADVVYSLRVQRERMGKGDFPELEEYVRDWQLSAERFGEHQVLMHPGPVNRGVELSDEMVEHPRSLILNQVRSGLVVRMAVLHTLLSGAAQRRSDEAPELALATAQ